MIECHCRPKHELLDVFEPVTSVTEGLFFCSNSGLYLYENEGTNERTVTGDWKCLEMMKSIYCVFRYRRLNERKVSMRLIFQTAICYVSEVPKQTAEEFISGTSQCKSD